MRFVTYRTVETEPRLGLLHDGLVIDVEYFGDAIGQDLPSTMLDFIDLGPIGPRFLREAIDSATTADLVGTSLPAGNVTLLAPIPRPRKRSEEHTSELQSLMRNSYPVFYLKNKNNTSP